VTAPIPVVPLQRHAAPSTWTPGQRRDLADRLKRLGTTILDLSDARELLGFPRLSEASPADRAQAHHNLESPELQAALATVRDRRAYLLETLSGRDPKAVRQARSLLDLRRSTPDLRLGELEALLDQTRIVELIAEGESLEAA
jgi:hypothetical protein